MLRIFHVLVTDGVDRWIESTFATDRYEAIENVDARLDYEIGARVVRAWRATK